MRGDPKQPLFHQRALGPQGLALGPQGLALGLQELVLGPHDFSNTNMLVFPTRNRCVGGILNPHCNAKQLAMGVCIVIAFSLLVIPTKSS